MLVGDGVYTGGATIVYINRNGTAANRIVFRAVNRWGAVIDGNSDTSTTGIAIPGGFVWVEGFEVRNTSRYGIDTYLGHDQVVIGNHVHDIGHICTGSTGGIVGIDAYASGLVIARNVIHDVGRLGPGEQGCVEMVHGLFILNNTFVGANPNRDAQVIIATETSSLVVANNIFYQPATAGVWFDGAGSGAALTGNVATGAVETGGTSLVASANLPNTDPLFVSAGGLDFHLTAPSPARGAGVAKWCPSTDFDGVARTGACSAGAFQN